VVGPVEGSTGSTSGDGRGVGRFGKREIVLYAHLSADAIRTRDADAPVTLENAGGQLLTAGQVAEWCGREDTTKVTVRPVIDLAATITRTGYQPTDQLAEQIRVRDRVCAFPWCQRPARHCDLDHIEAYDPNGPPGQTASDNLACLCRLHHRMKTHAGWTYTMLEPGTFLWSSPHGHTYLTDAHGTDDLTSPTVDQPAEPPER
jgi:hypothetical protein